MKSANIEKEGKTVCEHENHIYHQRVCLRIGSFAVIVGDHESFCNACCNVEFVDPIEACRVSRNSCRESDAASSSQVQTFRFIHRTKLIAKVIHKPTILWNFSSSKVFPLESCADRRKSDPRSGRSLSTWKLHKGRSGLLPSRFALDFSYTAIELT